MDIIKTENFELQEAANGTIVLLRHLASSKEVFLDGNEAIFFNGLRNSLEFINPLLTPDQILERLWSDFKYHSFAEKIKKHEISC